MCGCDNPPEFYERSIVAARKEHHCCECGTVIVKGERYERVSGKWEGDMETFKTCMPCVELRDAISDDGCFYYTHLADDVSQTNRDFISDARALAGVDEFELRRSAAKRKPIAGAGSDGEGTR